MHGVVGGYAAGGRAWRTGGRARRRRGLQRAYFGEIKTWPAQLLGLPTPATIAPAPPRGSECRRRRGEPRPHRRDQGGRSRPLSTPSAEINGRCGRRAWSTPAPPSSRSPTRTPSAPGSTSRDSDFTQRVSTANGVARVAPVMLDRVSIGDITVRNVPAAVTERGQLGTSLLGHDVLEPAVSASTCAPARLVLQE